MSFELQCGYFNLQVHDRFHIVSKIENDPKIKTCTLCVSNVVRGWGGVGIFHTRAIFKVYYTS